MKFLTLVVAVCTLQACYSNPAPPSEPKAKPGDFPFHAIIEFSGKQIPICEAVLIEKNYALTTASCMQKYKSNPKTLQVVVGTTSAEYSGSEKTIQKRSVISIELSPQWEATNKKYGDLAILKFKTPIQSNAHAKIADYGGVPEPYETLEQITYEDGEDLLCKLANVSSTSECESEYSVNMTSTDQFCIKSRRSGYGDYYAYGDSSAGAPVAFINRDEHIYLVHGITTSTAGIVTRLSDHKKWIESITRPGQPERTVPEKKRSPTSTTAPAPTTADAPTTTAAPTTAATTSIGTSTTTKN